MVRRPAGFWLPPLPAALTLGALAPSTFASRRQPVLGLVDLPRAQKQEPLVWDLSGSGGNLGVAGAPQTGKSTLLLSLVLALVKRFGPHEAQFYCLDLGGGGLFSLEGLPHVGAIAGPGEGEAAARLVHDMRNIVTERASRRRAPGDGHLTHGSSDKEPEIFVVVDNVGMLKQALPDLEPELAALATTGLHQGLHVVVSANRWFDIRPQLLDALGTKLELRLGDPAETLAKRDAARALPADHPGRGITRDGDLFQLALPSWSMSPGPDGEALAIAQAVAEARSAGGAVRAPRVAALPGSLSEDDVEVLALQAGSEPPDPAHGFLVGVSEFRSRPAQLDLLAAGAHLAVYGDGGSGRTTLLARVLDDACSRQPARALRIQLVDPTRGLIDFGEDPHVERYVTSAAGAEKMARELADELSQRLPSEGRDGSRAPGAALARCLRDARCRRLRPAHKRHGEPAGPPGRSSRPGRRRRAPRRVRPPGDGFAAQQLRTLLAASAGAAPDHGRPLREPGRGPCRRRCQGPEPAVRTWLAGHLFRPRPARTVLRTRHRQPPGPFRY